MKTARTSRLPPFCTQIVGTFPRPRVMLDLLARRQEFTPERFTQITDDLVRFCIRTQGLTGLDIVSDGQWHGTHHVAEFLRRVGGFAPGPKVTQQGPIAEVVVQRMNPTGSVYKADADFLVNNTARLTKLAIPSPAGIAAGTWHEDYSKGAYPTIQDFMDHLVAILCAEVHALVTAGIDIIQINDRALLRLCNPASRSASEAAAPAGRWSPETQLAQTFAAINRLVDSAQGKAEIHLHCCQGGGDAPHADAEYGPLLTRLRDVRIDRINLGFFGPGAGRIEDLALLPPNIDVGLGLLDVRPGSRQSAEDIQALARAAAAIVPPARIALNPDCSLNALGGDGSAFDEAYDRLRRLTAAAKGLRARHS